MPNTSNLGLSLFDKSKENEVYFENWSRNINGNGDGSQDNPLSDMQKIDNEFRRLYGYTGVTKLSASSWNESIKKGNMFIPLLTNNDCVLLSPYDAESKKILDEINPFVYTEGSVVWFQADTIPTVDISFNYRIVRGAKV